MLIDTHCHLNDPAFEETLPRVIDRARAAGVGACVVPAYDRPSLERTASLARIWPDIFPAFGLHPWFLGEDADCSAMEAFLQGNRAVAVGEIGLDFSPGCPPHALQIQALTGQLSLAQSLDLPVILHCRRAHEALYRILRTFGKTIRGVLHSFSGGPELMAAFVGLGFYISFSGSVTRKTAKKYHACAAAVPGDRLLLETDAPSIATETTVASKVEPMHTAEVARQVAALRKVSFEELCRTSTENACCLFKINVRS